MEPAETMLFFAILTQMEQAGKQGSKQASKQPSRASLWVRIAKTKPFRPERFFSFCYPHPRLALQLGYSQPSAFQAAAG